MSTNTRRFTTSAGIVLAAAVGSLAWWVLAVTWMWAVTG